MSPKLTSEQYLKLGPDPPGVRLELAHGGIVVSPSQSPDHAEVVVNLIGLLSTHIRQHGLGRLFSGTDIVFDEENTRRPDIAFFASSRREWKRKNALIGAPDFCVEVSSLETREIDHEDKFALYEYWGAQTYWIVDHETRTLEAYVLRRGKFHLVKSARESQVVQLPPFPDLSIALVEVWPED